MLHLYDYLVNKMDAVEFNGFNLLGTRTLWSVFALLAGPDLDEMRSSNAYWAIQMGVVDSNL